MMLNKVQNEVKIGTLCFCETKTFLYFLTVCPRSEGKTQARSEIVGLFSVGSKILSLLQYKLNSRF